jgi:segregation and condensation protein B
MDSLKNIIECLLFVAEEPLTVAAIRSVVDIADTAEIRQALKALAGEYAERNGGFLLKEVAGGWQFRTRPEYTEWMKRFLKPHPPRLSKAALETLAVIAYKQPIIRSEVEAIRGVDCGGVLRMLMERKLIRILGRKEIPGRPLIYATTKMFLEVFDLKDLKDLPTPKEIEELTKTALDEAQETGPAEGEESGKPEGAGEDEQTANGDDDRDAEGGHGPEDGKNA